MRILGVDPGIGRVGWGVVEEHASKQTLIDFGCLETDPKSDESARLMHIYTFFQELMRTSQPDVVAIEQLFFSTNVTTAFSVGQARGIMVLCAAQQELPVISYTPMQVKQAISGYGKAEKNQVQQMVKALLNMTVVPKPDDAADALAIALTHAFSYKVAKRVRN